MRETMVGEVIGYLIERRVLFSDGARLSFGDEGEALYGRRHFLELTSVFTSPPLFKVLHGRRELGTVHQIAFLRHRPEEPAVLSLGGKSWSVTLLEWSKRVAYVVPTHEKGKSRWLSAQIGFSYDLCRGIHDVLTDEKVPERWSSRARERMASLRQDHDFLNNGADILLVTRDTNEIRWFTFAGNILNLALADAIRRHGYDDVRSTDYWIRVADTTDHQHFINEIDSLDAREIRSAFRIPKDYLEQLKFSECLPEKLTEEMMKDRLLQLFRLDALLATERKVCLAAPLE
jgi:ATP-dependent Lhr-like helicase